MKYIALETSTKHSLLVDSFGIVVTYPGTVVGLFGFPVRLSGTAVIYLSGAVDYFGRTVRRFGTRKPLSDDSAPQNPFLVPGMHPAVGLFGQQYIN